MPDTKKNPGYLLWKKALKLMPGGGQLLSKRSEMFLPVGWPSYYQKAKGIEIWDLSGKKYLDFSVMGIGSCLLGYADDDVDKAVKAAIDNGSTSTLNCPEEVELAQLLLSIHKWAQMARFARTGGEAMSIAVRIARAYSRKDKIAFCGYHGWSDWYLAANIASNKNLDGHLLPGLDPAGVPRALRGTALPFRYNHIEDLEKILSNNSVGVIVLEPLRHEEPKNGFLQRVRKLADKYNAVLIFDEITIAWRLNLGGVHLKYKIIPDIAVLGKAMSNGFAMSAIIGKKEFMEAANKSFISSTYWTERVGTVAAISTISKMRQLGLAKAINKTGRKLMTGLNKIAKKHNIKLKLEGPPAMISLNFEYDDLSQAVKTLFTSEMLNRGFLAGNLIYVTYAHKQKDLLKYFNACDKVFAIISRAVADGKVMDLIKGKTAKSTFRRLT